MSDAQPPRGQRLRRTRAARAARVADVVADAVTDAAASVASGGDRRSELVSFSAFFERALDMQCIVAADLRLEKVNPAFAVVVGYGDDDLLGRSLLDFTVAADRQKLRHDFAQALCSTGSTCFESRWCCRDGTVRLFSWAAFADPERSVVYATARDYTTFRATEEQLNKLWLAVEQTSQGIVITDLEARIEYVNQAFSAISGYSLAEMQGQNPRMFRSGQTPQATYSELWATLGRGEIWHGEFINARKNGEVYVESARISPVRQPDGRVTHYLAIKDDITERKRASDAIRESKALLQGVIDATQDWIYVKDREHRFMLVNNQFAHALNQNPADMIGRRDVEFIAAGIPFTDSEAEIAALHADDEAVFAGGSIQRPYDKMLCADGVMRVFETYKTPIRDSALVVSACLCYRRDITERCAKEEAQKQLENQLRQAQKMELIGHLTGGIAHDFNNILSAVFGYAELLQMSPAIERSPELALYVQEILQAGIRAKELVAQLLTFSHRREQASQAINVTTIVSEVAKLLRSTMPASISIECSLADALPEVLISPVQLHQILMNLGINARDAISGQGTVAISARQQVLHGTRVCASCHQRFGGDYLMLSVRDNGSGIPPEHMPRIFDPFFTTKDVGRGSGLGLSVLHGIVHSANGHLEVLTTLGAGTEFRVFLPTQACLPSLAPAEAKSEPASSRVRGTVMVVDDEASIVRFMTVLLENLGCRVIGLTSPREALRLFQHDPRGVDLVLTDQTMPELSGIDLASAMLAYRPDLPIVLSTGYSNAIDEDAARQIGVRRFLMKPVPAKVLSDVVADYLGAAADEAATG